VSTSLLGLLYALVAGAGSFMLLMTTFRNLIRVEDVRKIIPYWFLATVFFALSPNPTAFFALSGLLLWSARSKLGPLPAMAFLVTIIPAGSVPMFGFGGINFLLIVSFGVLCTILLVLPLGMKHTLRRPLKGLELVDWAFWILLLSTFILRFRETSLTNDLRGGVTDYISYGVIYLAFSRAVTDRENLLKICQYLAAGLFIVATIGIFSQFFRWNFYTYLYQSLFGGSSNTKYRGALLRVSSIITPAPINYGLLVSIGLMVSMPFVMQSKKVMSTISFSGFMLFACLMSGSRGPFIAVAPSALLFVATHKNVFTRISKFVVGIAVAGLLLLATPQGRALIEYLPFIGSQSSGEVAYRQLYLEVSLQVIGDNFWFGTPRPNDHPLMQQLIQGEGIIDHLNIFIRKALQYGSIAAICLLTAYVWPGLQSFRIARRFDRPADLLWRRLGGALAACMATATIGFMTTSQRPTSEILCWMLIGLSVSYVRISLAELNRTQAVGIEQEKLPVDD